MTLHEPQPWELAEPERVLHDIAAMTPLRVGAPILALVADYADTCELVDVTRVQVAPGTHWNDASEVLHTAAERLPLPTDRDGPRSSLQLVVPRPGRVAFGPTEEYWLRACRYVSLGRLIIGPYVVLVTEHGWRFYMQDAVGAEPRLQHLAALPPSA